MKLLSYSFSSPNFSQVLSTSLLTQLHVLSPAPSLSLPQKEKTNKKAISKKYQNEKKATKNTWSSLCVGQLLGMGSAWNVVDVSRHKPLEIELLFLFPEGINCN